MLDNDISEIVDKINENTQKINEKISNLEEDLRLSETRRETAENMVSKIKETVSSEIQKAYESGYNAALSGTNPEGGTTITNQDNKTLVLSSQN